MTGDILISTLVILLTLNSSKMIVILLNLDRSKFIFTEFGKVTVNLLSLGKTLGRKKQSRPSTFDKRFKNHRT